MSKNIKRCKLYIQMQKYIQDELRKVQHLVLKNNLRWMDVEMALASNRDQQITQLLMD